MKKIRIVKNSSKVFAEKNFNQTIRERSSIFNENNSTILIILSKLSQIFAKITENVIKTVQYSHNFKPQ